MYASVADLRAEGVTEAQASDERLAQLLEEASDYVDHETGWWFEPRVVELTLSGRGTPTLDLPVPPIRIATLAIDGEPLSVERDALVVGAPVLARPVEPHLTLRSGVFPRARDNVVVSGVFGYTEPDGSAEGRTPLAIRRATMQLALRILPRLSDASAVSETRDRWRIVEERVRDQTIKWAPIPAQVLATNAADPEIAEILRRYCRPPALGAA